MGIVRSAMGFPHTFYVIAAPIQFLGITVDIKLPAELLHTRDLTMKGVQFTKSAFSFGSARNWTDIFHTGARRSGGDGEAHSHLRNAFVGGNLPEHRRPLHGKANVRSRDRDERLPYRHQISDAIPHPHDIRSFTQQAGDES
jgi:hypothetical protein